MPAPKFCTVDGCFDIAVKEPRSTDHCRSHYREIVLAGVPLVRFEVTAQPRMAGGKIRRPGVVDVRTGETVYTGGVVEIDARENGGGTNIAALVAAGLGRVLPDTAAEAVKAKASKGNGS